MNAQVAPVNPPAGGFAIDGGLRANTPISPSPFTTDQGDWFPGSGGNGGSVFNANGTAIDGTTTGMADPKDPYNGNDNIFTTGSKFNDYVNALSWTTNSAPDKNDINNVLYHVSRDASNNQWAFIAGDRLSTNGTSYIDFEFLQGTITPNSDGSFTGTPAAGKNSGGGRTENDMIISMEYTNGGSKPNVYIYQWKQGSNGVWSFQSITPPANSAFAETNRSGAENNLPYTAFGKTSYAQYAFVEAAINITALLQQSGLACAGLSVKTLWIKTKASASSTAALKDFVNPIPVNITFGSSSITQIGPFCVSNTTAQTLSATPSGGTFSGPGVSGNTFTPSVAGVGTHTISYSYSGCSATTTITVNPNPTMTGISISNICAGTASTSLSYTGTTGSPNQYRIDWDNAANTAGISDVSYTSFSSSPITISNLGSVTAGTYNGTIYVKNSTTTCESAGSPISFTINQIPGISGLAIGDICAGTTTASLTFTSTSGGANQYRIDWDKSANTAGLSDVAYSTFSSSPITISSTGSVAAGTYTGTIYVKNSTTTCESAGSPISLKINANPAITNPAIGAICFGTSSASLTYDNVTASANQYRIGWNSTAEAAGLVDVAYTNLPSSGPITISNTGSVAVGTYNGTIYVRNSTTGCESAGSSISLTVNAIPSITGLSIANICYGATSASLVYTGKAGGANQYRIDWNNTANTAGLQDVAYTSLPNSPITISGTGSLAAGTYDGTIYVKNSTTTCESAGSPISLTVNPQVTGPDAVMLMPNCTDKTFSVQVNGPVSGTTYTITQPGNSNIFQPITYNGTGNVIFTGLTFGDGFSVVASLNGCYSAATECGTQSLVNNTINQNSTTLVTQIQNVQSSITSTERVQMTSQAKVVAAPNPFNSKVKFTLESAVSGQGSLEIYNMLGQKVKTVYQGYIQKGLMQNVEYNVPAAYRSNLIYVFRVEEQRITGKLIGLR